MFGVLGFVACFWGGLVFLLCGWCFGLLLVGGLVVLSVAVWVGFGVGFCGICFVCWGLVVVW